MSIVIVNTGVGNIGAISNMLKRIGQPCLLTDCPDDLLGAKALILPGVGHFDTAVSHLHKTGLFAALSHQVLENKTPILGICLGMQLFASCSEEGEKEGLNFIPGKVERFCFKEEESRYKIPHMGWNFVRVSKTNSLLCAFDDDPRFYFVHSYHYRCYDEGHVLSKTNYGVEFISAIQKGHIFGVQFHPEKSHRFGLKLFQRFTEWVYESNVAESHSTASSL